MGQVALTIGKVQVTRAGLSYHQWMLQHVLDSYSECSENEQRALKDFLGKEQSKWLDEPIPERLTIVKYRLKRA